MTRARRSILAAFMAMALVSGLPAGASAAVSVDPAFTVLYVKGDEQPNQITVECVNGLVYVNGAAAADGKASCSDLEKLHVFGFGGDDVITLAGFGIDAADEAGLPIDEYGNQQSTSLNGGDGNDVIKGDAAVDGLYGGAGDDVLSGGGALLAFMAGGPGSDKIGGGFLFSIMTGGRGSDLMRGGAELSIGIGGGGADTYAGGSRFDFAEGGRGHDKLAGNGHRDLLDGQAGGDDLFGGPGRDQLAGGPGRDKVRGGPGRDREFQGGFPHSLRPHPPGINELFGSDNPLLVAPRELEKLAR